MIPLAVYRKIHGENAMAGTYKGIRRRISRSRELFDSVVLKFDRRLGSIAAEPPIKFQIDAVMSTTNLVAKRFREIRLIA